MNKNFLNVVLKKLIFFVFARVILITLSGISAVAAAEILHRPPELVPEGLPLLVEASYTDMNRFLWARLFVKNTTTGQSTVLNMNGSGNYFSAVIPENYIIANYFLEYSIEVTDTNREKFHFPLNYKMAPVRIKVSSAFQMIHVSILHPVKNAEIAEKDLSLMATVRGLEYLEGKEKIKVFCDDREVSYKRKGSFIQYKPDFEVSAGRHLFKVQILNEKSIAVAEAQTEFSYQGVLSVDEKLSQLQKNNSTSKEEWKRSGNLAINYQHAKMFSQQETPLANPNGYYTIAGQMKAETKGMSYFIGPFQFSSQSAEAGNRNQQFSAGLEIGAFQSKWGTISSSLSELSGSGFSYLGAESIYDGSKLSGGSGLVYKFFMGQSKKPLERSEDKNDLGVYSQNVYGGSVGLKLAEGKIEFSLQSVRVKDDETSIVDKGAISIVDSLNSSLLSRIQFSDQKYLTNIEFESAVSQGKNEVINEDTQLYDRPPIKGFGFSTKLSGSMEPINTSWQAGFKFIEPGFSTASGTSSDVLNTTLGLSQKFAGGILSTQQNLSYGKDNLKNQKSFTTHTSSMGLQFNLNLKNLPTFSFNDNLQLQENDDDTQKVKQWNNSAQFNSGYNFKLFSADSSLALSLSRNDSMDQSRAENETAQANSSLTPSFNLNKQWGSFSVTGSFTYTLNLSESSSSAEAENPATKTVNHSANENVSLQWQIKEIHLSVPLTITHSRTFEKSYAQGSDNLQLSLGTNWDLPAGQKLACNFAFLNFNDGKNADANYHQISVTLGYNVAF